MAAPILIAVIYVSKYGVNTVYSDEWPFVDLLRQWNAGGVQFTDLLTYQHNEHRLFIPITVFLIAANATKYDTVAMQYMGLTVLALTTIVLVALSLGTLAKSNASPDPNADAKPAVGADMPAAGAHAVLPSLDCWLCALVPIVWIMFSLRQWENYICGYSLSILLLCLFVSLSIFLLDGVVSFGWRFWSATLSALAATCCYANGLLVWPLGLLQLLANSFLQKRDGAKMQVLPALCWALLSLSVAFFYFYGYVGHAQGVKTPATAASGGGIIDFALLMLANPLAVDETSAIATGVVYAILLCWTGFDLLKNRTAYAPATNVVAPTMLLLFGVLSTALLVYARHHFGMPLSSRYASILNLGLIGLYLLILLRVKRGATPPTYIRMGVFATLIVTMIVASGADGIANGEPRRQLRLICANCMETFEQQSDKSLEVLVPGPLPMSEIKKSLGYLKDAHLSVFANPPPDPTRLPQANRQPKVKLEEINGHPLSGDGQLSSYGHALSSDGHAPSSDGHATSSDGHPLSADPLKCSDDTLQFKGWVYDEAKGLPTASTYIELDGKYILPAASGLLSTDLAGNLKNKKLRHCRFVASCRKDVLPLGRHQLAVKVIFADGTTGTSPSLAVFDTM